MIKIIEYTIFFALVVLIQVLLIDNIHIGSFVIINISILYIISLPLETPSWIVLLLSAILGATIDAMSGAPAINTITTTLLAYIRKPMVDLFLGKKDETERGVITALRMGFSHFIIFIFAMILLQNSVIFTLETLSFNNFHLLLLRIIASTICSTIFVYILHLPFFRGSEYDNNI